MTDKELLDIYVSFVPFLAEVCGKGCEIVVHDVTNPVKSVIAIANNTTGRELGSPMTDLALSIKEDECYKDSDFLSSYIGKTSNKQFLSSTCYIKNNGKLIGLLCVNKDLSILEAVNGSMQNLLTQFGFLPAVHETVEENLDNPVENLLHTLVSDTISQAGIPTARLSREEKIHIVHKLNEQGVLLMKGAVAEIASQLKISEPTVYRYLNHTD